MRLKKTVAVALATALLATTAAVPAFAAKTEMAATGTLGENGTYTWETKNTETQATVDTPTTVVKYQVDATYEWTIPSEIDFKSNAGVGKTVTVSTGVTEDETAFTYKDKDSVVKVTKNVIPEGKELVITAKGYYGADNEKTGFKVATPEGATLTYKVMYGGMIGLDLPYVENDSDAVGIMKVAAGTNSSEMNLFFQLTTQAQNKKGNASEIAGKYTGTLTYTAAVKDQKNGY